MRRQFLHPQFIIDDDGQLVVIISTIGFSSGLEICESVIVILLAGKGILFLISLALLPVLDPVVVLSSDSYVEKDLRLIKNKTTVYSVVAKVEGIQPRTMRTSDVYAQSSNAFALIG